jgi:glutaredoxin
MALPLLLLRQFTLTALKGILSLLIREDTHMDEIAAKPTRQTDGSAGTPPLKVYWQPGCSSCLKTKEFLIANGVEFISVNVLDDEDGFKELEALGVRLVPIVARGDKWANGAVFRDVAEVAGFEWGGHRMLAPAEMVRRIDAIMAGARRFAAQIPEDRLDDMLPGRPRSYRQLAYHIVNIPEVFLDYIERDEPYTYEAILSVLPETMATRQDLLDWAEGVRARFSDWWQSNGNTMDFSAPANVYYGEVSLHEVLERTAWHSGQHSRQLMLTLETKLGIKPDGALGDETFEGLPLPENIWDNERTFE